MSPQHKGGAIDKELLAWSKREQRRRSQWFNHVFHGGPKPFDYDQSSLRLNPLDNGSVRVTWAEPKYSVELVENDTVAWALYSAWKTIVMLVMERFRQEVDYRIAVDQERQK